MNHTDRFYLCASLSCLLALPSAVVAEDKAAPPAEAAAAHADPAHTAAAPNEPGADIVCEAAVSYSWKRRPVPPPPNARPSREESVPPAEPTTEFFTTVGEQGAIEEDTKTRVANKLAFAQAQALDECRKLHESQAGCVTDKLRKTAPDYSRLDFAGRKAILDSINADCTFNLGTCINASAGEIACRTNRPPDFTPPAAPAAAAPADAKTEGKDKKKK